MIKIENVSYITEDICIKNSLLDYTAQQMLFKVRSIYVFI